MSVNKVILVGHLGADPEVKFTGSGMAVATLRLATNEQWKDKSGKKNERTEWHRVIAWGKLAELCKEYLAKGRQIYVEGRIQTREWNDKDGNKRYTTEVVAQTLQFLGAGSGAGRPKQDNDTPSDSSFNDTTAPGFPVDDAAGSDNDIPF